MKDLLQDRLESASRSCKDPVQRSLIDAERAYHAARTGDFGAARELLTAIKELSQTYFSPPVAIWVMLSEGIVEFFEDLNPRAYDRFRRAYALSVSMGDHDLQALTSAWLAHIEFNERDYPAMILSVNRCLAIYPRGQSAAHTRIFMVLGNANLYAGKVSTANQYFDQARAIALADGDRTSVGAVVYNKAVLMLNNFRLQSFLDVGETVDMGLLSSAVESSTAFQGITRNRSLEELPQMCEARLAMIRGDFSSALKVIGGVRRSQHRHRGGAKDPLLDIEYATCLALSGDSALAKSVLDGSDLSRWVELDNDDQIIFFSQLNTVCLQLGYVSSIEDPSTLLGAAIERFSAELNDLRDAISCFRLNKIEHQ
jgi:hypothetical protein